MLNDGFLIILHLSSYIFSGNTINKPEKIFKNDEISISFSALLNLEFYRL
jgi:hypothetical protein